MIFPLVASKLSETFFCQQWIYNNNNHDNNHVKSILERHFYGILINSFRKKTFFCGKKLCCMQPLWRSAVLDKFYAIYLVLQPKKFYIRRNNNKDDSFETGHIVIADLLPWSDLEKGMSTSFFSQWL